MSILNISNLKFSYDKKRIFNNLSLKIEKATINIILGINGSGKSTLFDCIIGYNKKYDGLIEIFDKDIKELTIHNKSLVMSYIPQVLECKINYTVDEFLCIGRTPYIGIDNKISEKDYIIINKYVDLCKISHLVKKKLFCLSGGERQLVFLARALIQETPIIIMDEPFSLLDIINQHDMLEIMKNITINQSKTILLSTHNPNHGLYLNANVYLLSDGMIVDSGNAKEVIIVDKLKRVFGENIVNSKDLSYNEISFKN